MLKANLLRHSPVLSNRFCFKTGLPLSYGYANPFTPEMQKLVEASFAHTLKQVQIPHIDPQTNKISASDIFPKIDTIVTNTAADSKVYVYGGVVRSVLSFIYWYLINEHQKNPGNIQTKNILEDFLRKNEAYDFQFVLGLGSDLDILIDRQGSLDRIDSVTHEVAKFLDRYQKTLPTEMQNLFSLYGDVKNYDIQVSRSARQGGSPIDWLSFPITPRSGGSFREPQTHPGIIRNFLEGRVKIYPVNHSEARADTVIRVVRTLLDLPFLEPDSESTTLLCREIKKISKDAGSKVSNTFQKGVRNARFYEGYCHPVNRFAKNTTDALALALKQHSLQYGSYKNMPLLPEVLESQNILERSSNFDPGNLQKNNLLMSLEEFNEQHTDLGYLYHGTNNPLNLLSMFRGTFFVSNETQGKAVNGSGFYSTKDFSIAREYAQNSLANILRFKILNSSNIRILNLKSTSQKLLKQWQLLAKKSNLDLHSFLFQNFSIDIIINDHVLIQNKSAICLPTSISQILSEAAVQQNGLALKFVSKDIPNYEAIAMAAVQQNGLALKFVSKDIPNYEVIAMAAVQQSMWALQYISKDTPNYEAIAIAAVQKDVFALNYVPKDAPNYEAIAMAAVQKSMWALEYISKDTPNYEAIAIAAVQKDIWFLKYVPKDAPNYEAIAIAAVQKDRRALEYVPKDAPNYEAIAIAAVQKDRRALEYVPKGAPNYEAIAIAAVQKDRRALKYIPNDTPNYEPIAIAAVQHDRWALKYVPKDTPNYEAIAAVQKDVWALQYVTTKKVIQYVVKYLGR